MTERSLNNASLALERGTRFLLATQGGTGLWRDFLTPAGEGSTWPTAFIGAALHAINPDAPALQRAVRALVVTQNDDGGWGYNEDVPSDTDSTACVLLLLALAGGHESARARAGTCLLRQQRSDGGVATYADPKPIRRYMGVGPWWRFDGWSSAQTEVTAATGNALAKIGRNAEAQAAWRFVRSRQRDDGSWASYWWTSPHYATQKAVELGLCFNDCGAISRAVGWLLRNEELDRSAFATALSLSVLLKAGVGPETERAIARLTSLQDEDGGWPSQRMLRIPLPGDKDPNRPRFVCNRHDIIIRDQHRTFTTAACVAALARTRT